MILFKDFDDAWQESGQRETARKLSVDPSVIKLSMESRKLDSFVAKFDGFTGIDQNKIEMFKGEIIDWAKKVGNVKILKSHPESLFLEISGEIAEAVIKVFKAQGGKIVPTFRCIGGPKNGKKASDPSICMSPPNIKRRQAMRKAARQHKGSIANKRMKAGRTNKLLRRKVTKANQRLRKARGGI